MGIYVFSLILNNAFHDFVFKLDQLHLAIPKIPKRFLFRVSYVHGLKLLITLLHKVYKRLDRGIYRHYRNGILGIVTSGKSSLKGWIDEETT